MLARARIILAGAALLALAPRAAQAGPWTQEDGRGLLITSLGYSHASEAYINNGDKVSAPDFDKYDLGLLMEYGLTDWMTIGATALGEHVTQGRVTGGEDSETGLSNVELFARFRLINSGNHVFSIQPKVRVPGSFGRGAGTLLDSSDPDVEIRALYGYSLSFFGVPAFIDAQLGFLFRFGAPANEVRPDFAIGIAPTENWLLMAQSLNIISVGSAEAPSQRLRQHKIQLSVARALTQAWWLQFGAFSTIAGKNEPAENGLFAAIWHYF